MSLYPRALSSDCYFTLASSAARCRPAQPSPAAGQGYFYTPELAAITNSSVAIEKQTKMWAKEQICRIGLAWCALTQGVKVIIDHNNTIPGVYESGLGTQLGCGPGQGTLIGKTWQKWSELRTGRGGSSENIISKLHVPSSFSQTQYSLVLSPEPEQTSARNFRIMTAIISWYPQLRSNKTLRNKETFTRGGKQFYVEYFVLDLNSKFRDSD